MEFSIACSEVYYLFTNLKETELKKIPSKLVELICILKIDDYIPKININKPLEEQELSQATKELICLICQKGRFYLTHFFKQCVSNRTVPFDIVNKLISFGFQLVVSFF